MLEDYLKFGQPSAALLQKLLPQSLAVSPVTMVELSAAFAGDLAEQKRFLDLAGICTPKPGLRMIPKRRTPRGRRT